MTGYIKGKNFRPIRVLNSIKLTQKEKKDIETWRNSNVPITVLKLMTRKNKCSNECCIMRQNGICANYWWSSSEKIPKLIKNCKARLLFKKLMAKKAKKDS